MTGLRVFFHRLSGLLRKGSLERDMDDELDFHLQMEITENIRKGMSPTQAQSEAQRRLGGVAPRFIPNGLSATCPIWRASISSSRLHPPARASGAASAQFSPVRFEPPAPLLEPARQARVP